jgi:predicted aspartyl protease
MRVLTMLVLCCAAVAAQPATDLNHLFQTHQWFELRSMVTGRSPSLMRAAVAAAFNDPQTAERLLRDVIKWAPTSNDADEAYDLLLRIYMRSGQYHRWVTTYHQWIATMPGSVRARAGQTDEQGLVGQPDQINSRPRHAVLRHDRGDLTIPVSVNGKVDDFLFDTGAWHSVMSARMAERLGVKTDTTNRVMQGSSGQSTSFREAVAKEIDIGGVRIRNVSFAVIGTGPFADVDGGILGIPVLLALGTIRWSSDGPVEIGSTSPRAPADANLAFDRNRLLLRTRVFGRDVMTTLDTGATTTDLNANFAEAFPQAVQGAKKGRTDITGVGGTQAFDSLEMSEVTFGIGPAAAVLRPATITLQRISTIGGECCVGNAGSDLLKRSGFTIDFSTMTLRLNDTNY